MINLNRRAALLMLVAAISPLPAIASEKLPVVASFSILGDMTARIGGDRIELKTLVGPDGDGHVYQPTPADARAVAGARLVIVNGLAFEGWIPRLLQSSGTKATIVEATKGVTPREMKEGDDHDHDHDHDHGAFDPHAWQSVPNARLYASNIRDALITADPAGKEVYTANAAAYLAELDALDAEIRALVTTIPPERRKIITSHDAFGYFAEAYGLTFVAPQGVSTEAEFQQRESPASSARSGRRRRRPFSWRTSPTRG